MSEMAQAVNVVVRPLLGDKTLDGACRLHLSPETLDLARMKLGDLCEIRFDNGTIVGYGIAWRAADKMGGGNPSLKPVRMSEMLRDAFNLSEGTHITVAKTELKLSHASRIVLRDVTPRDQVKNLENATEDESWKWRAGCLLATCEAFADGITFEIGTRKQLKKRFRVVNVQSSASGPGLYYCNDGTEVVIDESPAISSDIRGAPVVLGTYLDSKDIGGLVNQLQALNERMKNVLERFSDPYLVAYQVQANEGVLIHGYEGTGKTHVMEKLEHAPFRKVLRLETSSFGTGGTSKNQDKIRSIFKEAEEIQPSLVLIDKIEAIAPASENSNAAVIASELRRLKGSRVLVIAACRNLADVNAALKAPGHLSTLVEFPAPDRLARASILRTMLPDVREAIEVADDVAFRTHGFTGQDLQMLVNVAKLKGLQRRWDVVGQSGSSVKSANENAVNGHAVNRTDVSTTAEATTFNVAEEPVKLLCPSWDDFISALMKVRPTALREVIFEPPTIGWQDIGGSGAVQERFDQILGWPLQHADAMKKIGRRADKGVLLYGPPGCSKTLTAQAVASHYGYNFIPIKGGELISMYVGESERAIREIFRKARQAAPCVIFFDEIDSIAAERETGSSKGLNVLTTLLNEMDGFETLTNVYILAATNKPDILDPAIMRPGRFDAHIFLGLPDAAARKEIFDIKLKKSSVEESVDLERLATDANGFSGTSSSLILRVLITTLISYAQIWQWQSKRQHVSAIISDQISPGAEINHICEAAMTNALSRHIKGGTDIVLTMDDLELALSRTKRSITPEMLASYQNFAAM